MFCLLCFIFLFLSCILYLTGRGDCKRQPGDICWPSTYVCVLVSYSFRTERPSFTKKSMWDEKTEPESLTFEGSSEIIKKAVLCQIVKVQEHISVSCC